MAIIIDDFKPSGNTVEVQFPGSKKRYNIPTSDTLTVGQLRAISSGDLDAFLALFDEDVQKQLDNLHPQQLNAFIAGWLNDPKE